MTLVLKELSQNLNDFDFEIYPNKELLLKITETKRILRTPMTLGFSSLLKFEFSELDLSSQVLFLSVTIANLWPRKVQ